MISTHFNPPRMKAIISYPEVRKCSTCTGNRVYIVGIKYTTESHFTMKLASKNCIFCNDQDEPLRKCATALSVSLSYMSKASATLFDENPISRKRVYPLANSLTLQRKTKKNFRPEKEDRYQKIL